MPTHNSMPTPEIRGLWLPLITPFLDGEVDARSLQRLVRHYATEPVDGFILCATTGEGLTLDDAETKFVVATVAAELNELEHTIPVFLGLSSSNTRNVAAMIERTAIWPVDGYLVTCPYYTRPSQDGLIQHFSALADQTSRPILIYNIPYRTGVNLANDAMLQLAEKSNIVGVKDCSTDLAQTFDLLQRRPSGFSVMTGEDMQLFSALVHGADGGITASAHVMTRAYADIGQKLANGDLTGARTEWQELYQVSRLLFSEPNPAPLKHWLWRTGLIDSADLRLPMTPVTEGLAGRIDTLVERKAAFAA